MSKASKIRLTERGLTFRRELLAEVSLSSDDPERFPLSATYNKPRALGAHQTNRVLS